VAAGGPGNRQQLGVRYSSQSFTVGAIVDPAGRMLDQAWLVGRRACCTLVRLALAWPTIVPSNRLTAVLSSSGGPV
jgi:hypothetical protein